MTDKNWQDEELWIVTASSSDNGSKQGMKAVVFGSSSPALSTVRVDRRDSIKRTPESPNSNPVM
jgi:hypothetical protein